MGKSSPRLPLARREWAYFLDVDGTLIDIVSNPSSAHVDDALLGLVARLHYACGGALALVSGRRLTDLDQLLGSVRVPLAGQHGLERRDGAGTHRGYVVPDRVAGQLRYVRQQLGAVVERHKGLLLEDKGASLALHYRQAPQLAGWLHRFVTDMVAQLRGVQLQKGKRVLEIKLTGFDKGSAIAEFMAEMPFSGRVPVFIGDDLTDEHGFERVNSLGGISVKVGAGRTVAKYRLDNVLSVRTWLAAALEIERGGTQ